MNRNRAHYGGISKASAATLCQKCLKKDSYECKVTAQERPYMSRPSRTQILKNPKLLPELSSDIPNPLLRKKGIADEQLARLASQRGGKGYLEEIGGASPRRARSASSHSSSSVSTVSTNRSRGSRHSRHSEDHRYLMSQTAEFAIPPRGADVSRKRRRGSSDASSLSPEQVAPNGTNRNTRRKHRSISPDERGRRRSRSHTPKPRKHRHSRSRSRSRDTWSRIETAQDRGWQDRDHSMKSYSPVRRPSPPRRRDSSSPRQRRRGRQSSRRRSSSSRSPFKDKSNRTSNGRGFHSGSREDQNGNAGFKDHEVSSRRPPKERSLSPYSKRVALTQAMNMGRR